MKWCKPPAQNSKEDFDITTDILLAWNQNITQPCSRAVRVAGSEHPFYIRALLEFQPAQ